MTALPPMKRKKPSKSARAGETARALSAVRRVAVDFILVGGLMEVVVRKIS